MHQGSRLASLLWQQVQYLFEVRSQVPVKCCFGVMVARDVGYYTAEAYFIGLIEDPTCVLLIYSNLML